MTASTREIQVDGGAGVVGMLKAALPVLPGVNLIPGVAKSGGELPDLVAVRRADVAADHVARYARVCGFDGHGARNTAPLPYLHMLAFPLHMALMTDADFPFPAIGTVHLENTITQHRPVALGESVSLSARAGNRRPHAKGTVYDIDVEVRDDADAVVWESTSTYLRIGRGRSEDAERGRSFADVTPGGIVWKLPADLGRRYAAVSGDSNPIHLYPLTAKAFGFKRQIAHGMWSKARSIAAIENRLPDAVRVEVGFRKPVFLPGSVSFGSAPAADGLDFGLFSASSGSAHLLGRSVSL